MASLQERLSGLQPEFDDLARLYTVPGATLAVMLGDEIAEFATGVLNLQTGVMATTDSVFQIGSITKLFTTSLVMQLADEGLVELDEPVRRYLPEFQVADGAATDQITLRHLVTHTSGIDGDYFLDTGRGDDCVERYVLACAAVPQLHPPGHGFSYCNAGFVIAGRVIERLRRSTWDRALRRHLLDPLGIASMRTLPEEALLFRAAAGHIPGPKGPQLAPIWMLPRSNGPAGATPFAAARDLLTFGRMHIDRGLAADRSRVLSEEAVSAMQIPRVDLEHAGDPGKWGLGWMLFDWGGAHVIGHDGGTIGQASHFRVAPAHGLAVAMLTNGGNGQALYRRVFDRLFQELAGITMRPLPEPDPSLEVDPKRFTGSYRKYSARIDIDENEAGGLAATVTQLKPLVRGMPPHEMTLSPIDGVNFEAVAKGTGLRSVWTFRQFAVDGRPAALSASRLHLRV